MSRAKDKKRAKAGGPFRNEPEGSKRIEPAICPVAGCGKTFFPEEGEMPLCPECRTLLKKLAWFLPRIKFGQPQTKEGLVLPGQQGFGAISAEVIKQEIERGKKL